MQVFVDATNIKKNIESIRTKTKKEIMAVVKSNAYGLGTEGVLKILKECHVKWLVYNTYHEYQKDQKLLQGFYVLILESPTIQMLKNKNSQLCFSINQVEDAKKVGKLTQKVCVHFQIDTGMNRIGIRSLEEMRKCLKYLDKKENISIDGIYTHFASDEKEQVYYEKQCQKFLEFVNMYPFHHIHSAATASLHKNIVGNMVRVGLGMYGYGNSFLPLFPSVSMYVHPIHYFEVPKNEPIGYGQSYRTTQKSHIAILPIGYDDICEIHHVFDKKRKMPIIGRICMNHMHILVDEEIKKITRLLVLSKHDIIDTKEYNWYHILTSLKYVPKCYIRRGDYDLPSIFETTNWANQTFAFRKRSN